MESGGIKEGLKEQAGDETSLLQHSWKERHALMGFHSIKLAGFDACMCEILFWKELYL